MPDKVPYEFRFPRRGLNKSRGYSSQVPDTTPDCLNVRPFETEEGRERGGVRPGLAYQFGQAMGIRPSPAPGTVDLYGPRLLETVPAVTATSSRSFRQWSDDFSGPSLGTVWQPFGTNPSPQRFTERDGIYAIGAYARRQAVLFSPRWYSNSDYWLGLWFDGLPHSTDLDVAYYYLYGGLAATADPATRGLTVGLHWYQDGNWWVELDVRAPGQNPVHKSWDTIAGGLTPLDPGPGWLIVHWTDSGPSVDIYLKNYTVVTGYDDEMFDTGGNFFGLALVCPSSGALVSASRFAVGYRTTTVKRQTELVGAMAGELYRINPRGVADQILYDYSPPADPVEDYIGDDGPICGASRGGKLYVANWDHGGSRVPLVYDPSSIDDTCERWVTDTYASGASKGSVPQNCRLLCRYRDRMALAAADSDPHLWYMSRMGDPHDFDYSVSVGDLRRAVAGTVADAGEIGEPITALVPHSDDYLVFGMANSIRVLRGDPVIGGQVDMLAEGIGVIMGRAWCRLPDGATLLMTTDGLYYLSPGAGAFPQSVSREQLPGDLIGLDGDSVFVLMAYDPQDRGVHIILHGDAPSGHYHYWFDWTTKGFWPVSFMDPDHEPILPILASPDMPVPTQVVFACRDGYIRAFDPTAWTDCGQPIVSYIAFGPIRLADDPRLDGIVESLIAEVGNYDPVYDDYFADAPLAHIAWTLHLGDTGHEALNAPAFAQGFWRMGLSTVSSPRGKGKYAVLKVAASATDPSTGWTPWSLERIYAEVSRRGRHRES